MKKFYSGKYRPTNPAKYAGNFNNITYRSLWERQVFRFLDTNPGVLSWSSEETPIPYICDTDKRMHRYMVDLKIVFGSGQTYLIEIKPKWETEVPKKKSKSTAKYKMDVLKYVKNMSKWRAAAEYAKKRGMIFEVWTEDSIRALGIKIL